MLDLANLQGSDTLATVTPADTLDIDPGHSQPQHTRRSSKVGLVSGHNRSMASAVRVAEIKPVLFPVTMQPGEGVLGLLARTAAENLLPTGSWILEAIGYRAGMTHGFVRDDPDAFEALAKALGQDPNQLEARRWVRHLPHTSPDPYLCSFHGALVVEHDLRPQTRRLAPAGLAASAYHRDLWLHDSIPFCTETGGLIIERCPREACGEFLRWHHTAGVHVCESCSADLREEDVGHVPAELVEQARPLTLLLAPDSCGPADKTAHLPPELQGLERGALFELGTNLGRVVTVGTIKKSRKLSHDEKVGVLTAGGDMLRDYPDSLARYARDTFATVDSNAGYQACRKLRTSFHVRGPHGTVLRKLQQNSPELFGRRAQKSASRVLNVGLNAGEAARRIGVTEAKFLVLRRNQHILPLFSAGGQTNEHCSFHRNTIESIAADVALRKPGNSIAYRLGLSRNGLEQLVDIGHLELLDTPAMKHLYTEAQYSSTSVSALIARLLSGSTPVAPLDGIKLHQALKLIGGRHKPWGPVIEAMLNGRIRYSVLNAISSRMLRHTILHTDDVPLLLTLPAAPAGERPHSESMTRDDAAHVLNLVSPTFNEVMLDELKPVVDAAPSKELPVSAILKLARERISGGEVAMRWMKGSRTLPPFLNPAMLKRLGAAGWCRRDAERLAREYRWPDAGRDSSTTDTARLARVT